MSLVSSHLSDARIARPLDFLIGARCSMLASAHMHDVAIIWLRANRKSYWYLNRQSYSTRFE